MNRLHETRIGTVKRKKNQARLLVTLEVSVDLSKAPSWQDDASTVLRALDQEDLLDRLRTGKSLKPLGIKVDSAKVEVTK